MTYTPETHRALTECTFPTQHEIEHLHGLGHGLRASERGTDGLSSRGQTRISSIEIKLAITLHIPRHHRPQKKMNMIASIDDPAKTIEILQGGLAVNMSAAIEHLDRSAANPEVDPRSPDFDITSGVEPRQGDLLSSRLDGLLNHRFGK